jgi:hypothetical protein
VSKRPDAVGFFWQDLPPVKPEKVEKPKRTPPEPVWLLPTYLPGLEEARAFRIDQFEDYDLAIAAARGERLVFDIECYTNYFLIAFKSIASGKTIYFERTTNHDFNAEKLRWIVKAFCLISFNGIHYDLPILALALAGASNAELKQATTDIIEFDVRPHHILKKHKVKALTCNHIDIIEVAPLDASLKIYGGRLHCHKMQDLPFHPNTVLSQDQIAITRQYCINDLDNTELLYRSLDEEIALREKMSVEYGVDLRSKSDAQIAEAVVSHEVERYNRQRCKRPAVLPGHTFKYKVPDFLRFETPLMNWTLEHIRNTPFVIAEDGTIDMPEQLKELKIPIANSVYRMGMGGLHSSEKRAAHFATENVLLIDKDVTSYYPMIILLLNLYPKHLGPAFIKVYQRIVERRIAAKISNDKVVAETLKIVVNGSFGKLGSPWSILYAPELLVQVTVTGQLSLLMLIERLELAGISVVSANTDGVVSKVPKHLHATMDAIVAQWEKDTGFSTEETLYKAVLSRDVNNYFAIKLDNKVKSKGAFALPERAAHRLHKNPTGEICAEAVIALLTTGLPIAQTVRSCTDIRKFANVRTVSGGAVRDGAYLGKSIRWYYAINNPGEIIAAKSGNKVPLSDGAMPMMQLPDSFPDDVDYDWYIKVAEKTLVKLGLV